MDKIKIVKLSEVPVQARPEGNRPRTLINEQVGEVKLRVVIVDCPEGTDSGEHAREWDEVLYYMRGEATVEVTGGETHTFGPGTLIVIPRGLRHRHMNRKKEVMRQILIDASPIKP